VDDVLFPALRRGSRGRIRRRPWEIVAIDEGPTTRSTFVGRESAGARGRTVIVSGITSHCARHTVRRLDVAMTGGRVSMIPPRSVRSTVASAQPPPEGARPSAPPSAGAGVRTLIRPARRGNAETVQEASAAARDAWMPAYLAASKPVQRPRGGSASCSSRSSDRWRTTPLGPSRRAGRQLMRCSSAAALPAGGRPPSRLHDVDDHVFPGRTLDARGDRRPSSRRWPSARVADTAGLLAPRL